MTDIALVWNAAEGRADIAMNGRGTDLQTDAGLTTAVIISLFTNAAAPPGTNIPGETTNRGGYWGDMPLDPTDGATTVATGSLLYLYENGLQTPANLLAIEAAAENALAWLVKSGIAGSVNVTATFPALGQCDLQVDIEQQGGTQSVYFANAWGNS